MDYTQRLHHQHDVIAQPNGADLVLFDMSSGHYFSLNEMGRRIWELCDGNFTLGEVAATIGEEYDASPEVITADVEMITALLIEKRLLRMENSVATAR